MWPFKWKKRTEESRTIGFQCTNCGSVNIRLAPGPAEEQPMVRTWRGQRYIACRCADCGEDFYLEEEKVAKAGGRLPVDEQIDEDALRAAEDEIRRQAEENDDRMFG